VLCLGCGAVVCANAPAAPSVNVKAATLAPVLRIMVSFRTTQLCSTAHARPKTTRLLPHAGNLQPAATLGWGRFGRAREFSMRIDRVTTEKFVAMLGVTLSFLFLLALIAFAFV
jgi:hypothetical protein